MQSFKKTSTVILVLILCMGAYSMPHKTHFHNCFRCIEGEENFKNCVENLMENMSNFTFTPLNHGLEKNSLSPWTYEDDINEARYPRTIQNAKCKKLGCPNLTKTEEIEAQIHVLMREVCDLKAKSYRLKMDTYKVKVGCTCVKLLQ